MRLTRLLLLHTLKMLGFELQRAHSWTLQLT
jgi:hypothetical protein